jgi:protein SCO1
MTRSFASFASIVAALGLAVLGLGVMTPAAAHGGHTPPQTPDSAATAAGPWGADYFPNVELTTHEGRTVRFYDDLIKGKSVAINLIFTECTDVCPLETAKLRELQRLLGERVGKDVFFYSLSIDPKNDTPPVLKAYAQKFDVAPGWVFLTGKAEDIKLVARKVGLLGARDRQTREGHSTTLTIGDEPSGRWMKNSATDNPRFLAATMETFLGWKPAQPQPSYALASPVKIGNGQYVFQNGCASCHTIGQGDKIGPDLLGVTERRDADWLTRYILVPNEVLAAGDPIATDLFKKYKNVRMPNLGLARDEVADLLGYIKDAGDKARQGSRASR